MPGGQLLASSTSPFLLRNRIVLFEVRTLKKMTRTRVMSRVDSNTKFTSHSQVFHHFGYPNRNSATNWGIWLSMNRTASKSELTRWIDWLWTQCVEVNAWGTGNPSDRNASIKLISLRTQQFSAWVMKLQHWLYDECRNSSITKPTYFYLVKETEYVVFMQDDAGKCVIRKLHSLKSLKKIVFIVPQY